MADESESRTFSENPYPQEKQVFGDDITPSQEQQVLPDRLPQCLTEWLARLNRHHLALNRKSILKSQIAQRELSDLGRRSLAL